MSTITHEQATALFDHTGTLAAFLRKLADLGITITPPQPSSEMVSLAERLAYETGENLLPRDYTLAALQHVERVVKDAQHEQAGHFAGLREGAIVDRVIRAILTAIGSK